MSEEVDMNEQNEDKAGVFVTCDDVLNWARAVAYEIGFVTVIMRSDTNTSMRGTSFVLIGCERSGQYRSKKKDFVRRDTLVEHPYDSRLTKDEKIIIVNMTKSMVKLRNILLTLKEHNAQ
ncbi:hypothetical protein HKD37_03G007524 [Glycine soja]